MRCVYSSGIGTGAGSSIFGFLTRSTATEDRATVFAAVMACRQAGLLIGQSFSSLTILICTCVELNDTPAKVNISQLKLW